MVILVEEGNRKTQQEEKNKKIADPTGRASKRTHAERKIRLQSSGNGGTFFR